MSRTTARVTVQDFTSAEIGFNRSSHGAAFLNISDGAYLMVDHGSSSAEEKREEINALRKLARVALELAAEMETKLDDIAAGALPFPETAGAAAGTV